MVGYGGLADPSPHYLHLNVCKLVGFSEVNSLVKGGVQEGVAYTWMFANGRIW